MRKNLETQKENLKAICQEISIKCEEDKKIAHKKIELIKNFFEMILLPKKFNNIKNEINEYFSSNISKNNNEYSVNTNDISEKENSIKLVLKKKKLDIVVEKGRTILVIENENRKFYSLE